MDLTDKPTPYNKSTTEEEISEKLVNQRMIKKEEKNELDVGGESAGLQRIVERERVSEGLLDRDHHIIGFFLCLFWKNCSFTSAPFLVSHDCNSELARESVNPRK